MDPFWVRGGGGGKNGLHNSNGNGVLAYRILTSPHNLQRYLCQLHTELTELADGCLFNATNYEVITILPDERRGRYRRQARPVGSVFLTLPVKLLLSLRTRPGLWGPGYPTGKTGIYVVFSALCLTTAVQAVDTLVDLGHAKYQGLKLGNNVNQWLGIRYAAPCNGVNRFKPPQPVIKQTSIVDATIEGALCLSKNSQEGLQYNSPRQLMKEDCLYMGIYAPSNATKTSKLPIMFFIQGGGFGSNSNGNYNGSGLVEASGGNMIVVRINYRVGILGFIGGTEVAKGASGATPNNGFRDMIAAARFIKQYATVFGGDPDHIVLSGASSGAEAINILLASNNGKGWPGLFIGAAVESPGIYSVGTPKERDIAFNNNVNSTGCSKSAQPIECMRNLNISQFQSLLTSDGWGPTLDGEYCVEPAFKMWEKGHYQKVPMLIGSTSNEGTPSYISNINAATEQDISSGIKSAVPSITKETLARVLKAYPNSLNNISFFGRDVAPRANVSARIGTGAQWQRDAAIKTELKVACTANFFADMNSMVKNNANWQYRWNVLDQTPGGAADQGLFSPHTQELYGIWGPLNTDRNDPGCFEAGSCTKASKIIQAYWISFIRSLDPNLHRLPGTPTWETWSINKPNRIVFDNQNAIMEVVGTGQSEIFIDGLNQRLRCVGLMMPLAKAVALNLAEGGILPKFADGARVDPTLVVLGKKNGTGTSTD
ncbi:hypothetical protein CROQUDRAFT_110627 [Cronartium quercuum f. sp. fusiforme G11]|uniref:Carboxylesterase type B domain-containing protein n=1 Tax=Cronartium quercuum f. sp. fusiforme G11 TaxID=708437 RepID=A0A9P6NBJ9_9BASI|nr:hypothetical protein CROQUDRAFT_110627 [Cronartium quercuum f. sp. fusiforme G11]